MQKQRPRTANEKKRSGSILRNDLKLRITEHMVISINECSQPNLEVVFIAFQT